MNTDQEHPDQHPIHESEGIGVESDPDAREFRISVARQGSVVVVPMSVEGAEALMRSLEDFLARVS